ncbi:MAG: 16S rRNA (guanine(966)-N(2))-methyltransferase RsmD [Ruminiclostridium sp.]|nr:16S rRNA (guanine(966)-N(2))-methyltransferase RsmD [Ruminiclostridium sp.]
MRVITGSARGRKLKAPEGYDVRPTSDGVKEAIFSAIQFEIEGRTVLDLFAGSGQLGIEAISRGAKKTVFVDSSQASIKLVRENVEHVGFEKQSEIINMPNTAFLRTTKETFDIALLDPPYDRKLIQKSLPALTNIMSDEGVIVCEHEIDCRLPEEVNGFVIVKSKKHGKTGLTIYRKPGQESEE